MSDIVISGLYKSFGEKKVLSGFSCVVRKGSFTAFTGPSGCGKTTLTNIIMGLVKPDSGTVTGVPGRVSAVFQEDRLCEDYSAVSNVYLVTGRNFPRKKITDCLSAIGLEGSFDKPVREFSGGMKRRVAIARALLAEYDLLVLDEPFKELDAKTKTGVMEYIRQSAGGKTVILVTHNRGEAEFFGADVIEMHNV